ncbi:hypothetical protein D1Z97_09240 [Riemerella anatipestifer]|uniref:GTPase domain-containing protein n=1 Tax=Riemerella anatipestifer TaxID=34085 RepID=UPI00129DE940|nr:GTPase domain-containing protein [Riemerella anatipestifer]MDR7693754.1 GTPase domain-containing protein [Riemerella anatipestifer]MDR7793837.1 GTPase domain-containing protein [Riemerella anatipestifer]MRM97539.1 hypothetical protein [Riemerella anatipestifer]MRN01351.1 hypothetical protein [Riemerella anatipestifer]MRN03407.1 hypothetical protein [Riemerella anatipestifer]
MIPIIIGLGLAWLFLEKIGFFKDVKNGDNLCVIGMPQAGKTRFLSYLRRIPFLGVSTDEETHEDFVIRLKNETEINIKKATDLGGMDTYREKYSSLIEESQYIFFFFNIKQYLENEEEYQRKCNSRLLQIFMDFENTKKSGGRKKKIILFGTHKDLLTISETEALKKFKQLIEKKKYKNFKDNVLLIDTTKDEELKLIVEKIFA